MAEPLQTYYDLLQVERHASAEHIRQAYRKLAQKYHPDKVPGDAGAVRAMAAINAAYQVLSDAQQRAEYDRQIFRAEPSRKPSRPAATASFRWWASVSPVANWPWYVLIATMAVALATIGTAIYLSVAPVRASTPAEAKAQASKPDAPKGSRRQHQAAAPAR